MTQHPTFEECGYVLKRGLLPAAALDRLERQFLDYVEQLSGVRFDSMHGPEITAFLAADRVLEMAIYDGIRKTPMLEELSLNPALSGTIEGLAGEPAGLLEKIVFRIDLPGVMREIAVWHQDFFYVRGNQDTITAWMPLQDTPYELGCLMVMPGSHELGPVAHDRKALGKRDYSSAIFERNVRYIEMKRGDVLFFHALLFHSSGVNVSDRIRFSVQARFSPLSQKTDPGMGRLIPLAGEPNAIA